MKKSFTLVEVMIVTAIIVLLAAIAIPNLMRSRLITAEAIARASLKTMAAASEMYAAANQGNYPPNQAALMGTPPYLDRPYCGTANARNNYRYDCVGSSAGYTFIAIPQEPFVGQARTFTITTGAVLTP